MDLKDILSGVQTGFQSKKGANALIGLGTGLLSGNTFAKGMAAGGQGYMQGAQLDDAEAQRMDRTTQWKSAIENIRTKYNRPDVADMLESAGEDGINAAWGEVLKGKPAATDDWSRLNDGTLFNQKTGETKLADGGEQAYVDPKDAFNNEKDLASQYNGLDPVKTYQAVRSSYERVRQSADMGNNNPDGSGAADLSLIFAYMKMLDPTSVVREGEQASAANAGGVPAQVMNLYNNLVKGDKLTPGVRQQFVQSADAIYKDTAQNLSQTNDQYTSRAQGWGVDPGRFVTQPESYPAFAPPAPAGNQPRRTQTGVTWSP